MVADLGDDFGVAVEIAVPALGFVRGIAHQRVAGLPAVVGARGAGFAGPAPEIGARDRAAGCQAGFGVTQNAAIRSWLRVRARHGQGTLSALRNRKASPGFADEPSGTMPRHAKAFQKPSSGYLSEPQ